MRKILLKAIAALVFLVAPVQAQDRWVQIEALPTLAQAEERARAWASAFPEVNGFRMSSGWYAIALGPYPAATAENRLFALRTERLIPQDSYIADGALYRSRFWPVGGGAIVVPDPQAQRTEQDQVIAVEPPSERVLPDETPAEARRSEAVLNADQRKSLQTALQWFGHYNSAIDGAFGRGTRASMAAWQRSQGYDETGILTTGQRAELLDDYRADLAALGLGRVAETQAGIEIEMPIDLVEFDAYAPPFVRYREKDGSGVQVLLISQEGTQATLNGLFDVMQTLQIVPLEGFRERQGNSFVLTGRNERIHSHTYARLENGMVKGFTLVFPADKAEQMTRAAQIMRDTLVSTGSALDPTLGPRETAQSRDLLSGLEIRQPERTRSGVYVDRRGAVLTVPEAVEGCARVTLDEIHDARVVASDPSSGLTLLRPIERLAPMQVAELASADPRIGAAAGVAGFPFGGALPSATLTFGTVEDVRGLQGEAGLLRLQTEAEPGEAGGPVFDPAGRVAGILLPEGDSGSRDLPPGVRFAAKAGVVASFLAAQGIEVPEAPEATVMAPEDMTDAAMRMTVLVSCWN